jgi:NADH:ubiquinone oxidoreductase subunit 4 (subunit M)
LIPALFLILGWGYQPERLQAGIYLLFYTLFPSLPLLVGILFIYNISGSLCLFLLCGNGSLFAGLFRYLFTTVKVNFALEQALNTQRWSRDVDLFFL